MRVPASRKAKTRLATAARERKFETRRSDQAATKTSEGDFEHEISGFRAAHNRDEAKAKLTKQGLYEYAVKYSSALD